MEPRQCNDWIESFKEWTVTRSQAVEALIEFTAIWTLAAALRRRVWVPKSLLGSWSCYPHLYVMIVGPSGIGKTTTLRYAYELLSQLPDFPKPPTFVTPEGIIDEIVKSSDHSSYLSIEEFGDLFIKDKSGKTFELLTTLYDGKADMRQKTMARDVEYALKPCLNVFAGTTPEWIADNIPMNTLNGGFGSRFLWLYVDRVRQRRLFYTKEYAVTDFASIEQKLLVDLLHISTKLEGEFSISEEDQAWTENWYQNLDHESKNGKKLNGYLKRKPEFVLKLAMIMHVARSDTLIIEKRDIERGIELIEQLEKTLPKIFEGVGKNVYSLEMRDIAIFVAENPGIRETDLRETFRAAAEPAKLSELIDGLLMGGVIRSDLGEGGKRVFYLKED